MTNITNESKSVKNMRKTNTGAKDSLSTFEFQISNRTPIRNACSRLWSMIKMFARSFIVERGKIYFLYKHGYCVDSEGWVLTCTSFHCTNKPVLLFGKD